MTQEQEVFATLLNLALYATPILIGVIAFLLYKYVRPYLIMLEAKVADEVGYAQWQTIKEYAVTFIYAAAQKRGLDTPEARYEYVFNLLVSAAAELNIPVTEDQIDALLEGTYNQVKKHIPDMSKAALE